MEEEAMRGIEEVLWPPVQGAAFDDWERCIKFADCQEVEDQALNVARLAWRAQQPSLNHPEGEQEEPTDEPEREVTSTDLTLGVGGSLCMPWHFREWLKPSNWVRWYDNFLQQHIWAVSWLQGTVLGVLGDIAAQHIEHWSRQRRRERLNRKRRRRRAYPRILKAPPLRLDKARVFRAAALSSAVDGALIPLITRPSAALNPAYFITVDKVLGPGRDLDSALTKAAATTVAYDPMANAVCLGLLSLCLEGGGAAAMIARDTAALAEELRSRFQALLLAEGTDLMSWPPIYLGIYALLPLRYRPLAASLLGAGLLAANSAGYSWARAVEVIFISSQLNLTGPFQLCE
ncbi:unnamed protein product [Chrysoparadoxa australica]